MKGKQDGDIYNEITENLAHIKALTKHKQSFVKFTSPYFILWGFIWVVAFSVTELGITKLTIGIWVGLTLIGWIFTLITFINQKNKSPIPIFLGKQLKMVWIAILFLAVMFSFLISNELLVLSIQNMALYIFLLTSFMYLLLGIVLAKELFYMGTSLGILGIFTYQFFLDYIFIIFSVVGGGCLVLTGILMKYKGKQDE
ncbi:hypothetical protein [Bacillus sp. JJ722]|uniref:hypothetical protein n=1 Tax=Bacillus sp. JJ722 TaxID=3122973 RepID=UPI00300055AB